MNGGDGEARSRGKQAGLDVLAVIACTLWLMLVGGFGVVRALTVSVASIALIAVMSAMRPRNRWITFAALNVVMLLLVVATPLASWR
jgi:nitrate reductase NapE component